MITRLSTIISACMVEKISFILYELEVLFDHSLDEETDNKLKNSKLTFN